MNTISGIWRTGAEKRQAGLSAQEQESTFKYERLKTDAGTSYIRLLKLEDGSRGSVIRCRLFDADLDASTPPRYEAVSYSWRKDVLRGYLNDAAAKLFPDRFPMYAKEGEAYNPKLILCNGKVLHVQRNLYYFLVRLRAKQRGLPLWIDAICIEQDENDEEAKKEKYRQLAMMGRIYGSAQTVLVWLGESSNITSMPSFPKSLRKIEEVQIEYEGFRSEYDIVKVRNKAPAFAILPRLEGTTVESLARLLNRDYFQRAWVVQELVLARQLVFFVGGMEIPSAQLLNAIQLISACGLIHTPLTDPALIGGGGFRAMTHMLQAQQDHQNGRTWPFDDFLFLCRDRLASKPEDKILSLLGLVDPGTNRSLIQETLALGLPLDKLYTIVTKFIAGQYGWSYVLSLAAVGAAEGQDLPSWVPDFRDPLYPKPFWFYGCTHFKAASTVAGNFSVDEGSRFNLVAPFTRCLVLSASYIDEVAQVGESHAELRPKQCKYADGHFLDLIAKLENRYSHTDEPTIDAVMKTLTADVFGRDNKIPMAKLQHAFIVWLETTISNLQFSRAKTKPGKAIFSRAASKRNAALIHDCGTINGTRVKPREALAAFLTAHDSDALSLRSRVKNYPRNAGVRGAELAESAEAEAKLLNQFEANAGVANFWKHIEQQVGGVGWAIDQMHQHRRLFRTRQHNFIGLASRNVRPGDVVCLVAGTDTPFVFRRTGNSAGVTGGLSHGGNPSQVRLVGSAYLHGAMQGELVQSGNVDFVDLLVL
ncbi:heterokaryon incompatibility protein-domain-containing protein [Hypoxylon sp. FL1284]|nr:heterokaryon incompatibility protein-domain-containing protein [Hypoxylon sp. FL1284]